MNKVVVILSHKSSGSSALQRLLLCPGTVNCIQETRHFQNESLYWTKAASVLNLPQQNMLDSEVPIPSQKARHDLIELLSSNLLDYKIPTDDTSLIFDGWRQLCYRYGPVFLEKSPHHLLQWSALELLLESMNQLSREVDFLLVGLVRNPMDMLYSAFQRWKTPPEVLQYEWMTAYNNLRRLSNLLGDRVVIVRYEDLTVSLEPLMPVFEFCGTSGDGLETLSDRSLLKWKDNSCFGFVLASEVKVLARSYDYAFAELHNTPHQFWPIYSAISRIRFRLAVRLKEIYYQLNKQ